MYILHKLLNESFKLFDEKLEELARELVDAKIENEEIWTKIWKCNTDHPYNEEHIQYLMNNCITWSDANGILHDIPERGRYYSFTTESCNIINNNFTHTDALCTNYIYESCENMTGFRACREQFPTQSGYDSDLKILSIDHEIWALKNEINIKINHNSQYPNRQFWEPFGMSVLGLVSFLSLGAVYYSYREWKSAHEIYQHERSQLHDLASILKKPKHMNRIVNLTNRFNISLKDVKIENLIIFLNEIAEQLYLKRKCRLTFLNSDFTKELPEEIIQIIFQKAELMPEAGVKYNL